MRTHLYNLALVAILALGTGLALTTLQEDTRLLGDRSDLAALNDSLEMRVSTDDLVLIDNPDYLGFFLNKLSWQSPLGCLALCPRRPL